MSRTTSIGAPFLVAMSLLAWTRASYAADLLPDHVYPPFLITQPPAHIESGGSAQIVYGLAVLAFGAAIIALEVYVMIKQHRYWDTWSTKMIGLTLVITAGLFLIPAGYSQEQIAPLVGLLGTIAGYLLGWEGNREVQPRPPHAGSRDSLAR